MHRVHLSISSRMRRRLRVVSALVIISLLVSLVPMASSNWGKAAEAVSAPSDGARPNAGSGTMAVISGGGNLVAQTSRNDYDTTRYTTQYGYDPVGNMTVITDANGTVTHLAYDDVNRLTQVTYPDSEVSYTYDSLNNRTSMTDPTGTTSYSYDLDGRLTSVTPPGQSPVEYGYNDAGQRNLLTYPDDQQVEYGYDSVGRLNSVTDWNSNTVTYNYDDAGRLTGADLPNNTSTSYTYDDANRLTQLVNTSTISGTINSFDYTLDNVGNRTSMTDNSGTTNYSYDDAYQLTQVTYPDSSSTSYEYDSVGNRTVMTDATGATTYTYDAANRLQSAGTVSYTWDQNGNMASKVTPTGTIDYTYDAANRLTEVTDGSHTYQYSYNGDGVRTRKTINGGSTDYVWDTSMDLPVVLKDSNDLYLYGLGLIAQQNGSNIAYYHPDGLGTIRSLTDSSGRVIVDYSYDAFGSTKSSSGSWNNDFRFTGEQFDSETGLYYLRARYYDPSTGRFTAKDLLKGVIVDPWSLAPYPYVRNNPANLIDPTGLWTFAIGPAGLAGFGAGIDVGAYPIVFTGRGELGVEGMVAPIAIGLASFNGQASFQYTTADNLEELKGISWIGGASWDLGISVGGESSWGYTKECKLVRGYSFGLGLGFDVLGSLAGLPGTPEIHFGPAVTWTVPWSELLRKGAEPLPRGKP